MASETGLPGTQTSLSLDENVRAKEGGKEKTSETSGSLGSKRFQSSYCAKVRAEAIKKGGRGRGRGEEETLARKPHDSEKRPLIFHGSVRL